MTFVEVSNIPRWRAVNSYATCTTRGLSHVSPQHRCITVFKQPVMKLSRCRIDVKHTTRCLRSVTHHVGDGSGCNTGRRKTNRASSYEALDMSVMRPDVWLRSLNSAHLPGHNISQQFTVRFTRSRETPIPQGRSGWQLIERSGKYFRTHPL
jgi:hypothetical protein